MTAIIIPMNPMSFLPTMGFMGRMGMRRFIIPILPINPIADAIADLGKPEAIGNIFCGFQQFLYKKQTD